MSGWIALAGIGIASGIALVLSGIARVLWLFVGAALTLGAAGYAWQGRPGLGGDSVAAYATPIALDPAMLDLRDTMFGRFTADGAYLSAADAVTRSGDTYLAVRAVLGGIAHYPRSLSLWTGLGTALAANDGDTLSPAALFAFHHAMRLAPLHPAPRFFLGLAYLRANDLAAARRCWNVALRLTPPTLAYHDQIAFRLALLDRYMAMAAPPRLN